MRLSAWQVLVLLGPGFVRIPTAGVEEEMKDAAVAYARFSELEPTRYRDGWLPST